MDGDLEVPLYGDWVLFAVMSEKSALKYTNKTPSDAAPTKYFSCKLLDLNTQYTNIYHELPGHCVMNMLAFESTRGTSAFDKLWKERDRCAASHPEPPHHACPKRIQRTDYFAALC